MNETPRKFDVIVWGASGFTGRLVAQHFFRKYGATGSMQWAVGGRDPEKLREILHQIGDGATAVPIVVADAQNRESMDHLAAKTRVIASTVGPYAKYGSALIAACVEQGTDYCDLCGEVPWMRRMIDTHHERARQTGARIVHCCGFDSIPSDLGCYFLNQQMNKRLGQPCRSIKLRVKTMRGGFSGGTVASLLNVIDEAQGNPETIHILKDPYALNPTGERSGPDGMDQTDVRWDKDLRAWTTPFVMAMINTRVVRRSNALLGYPYGRDFRYEEAIMTRGSSSGWMQATAIRVALGGLMTGLQYSFPRSVLERSLLPTPGQGPSEAARAAGRFKILLVGYTAAEGPPAMLATVSGDQDPGYACTSRMLAESATCLALDVNHADVGGGFWTPASSMGERLITRLEQSAGIHFSIVPSGAVSEA